jgi:CRISPR-associated protein Cmr1
MRKLPKELTPAKLSGLKAAARRTPVDETFLLGDAAAGAPVKAITPVLGGNVESFEPGQIDLVRVPSVRGALRWWWRALHPELSTSDLRALERKVWGGVGRDASEGACASRVRIDVKVTNRGEPGPPGKHMPQSDGMPKAVPDWSEAEKGVGITQAGYALFPLQQPREKRLGAKGQGEMPTKEWRTGLEFELRVSLVARNGHVLSPEEGQRVREALWLWLTFGGYGARTRRGFGALHAEAVGYEEARCVLERVQKGRPRAERPTLGGCVLLEGPVSAKGAPQQGRQQGRNHWQGSQDGRPQQIDLTGTAGHALGVLLKALHTFRQGTTFGRNPGKNGRPGRSRWPEADSLRRLSGAEFRVHKIDDSFKSMSAPRSEFGLPLEVKFIRDDVEDQQANGSIANTKEGGRWASPLLLRPVRVAKDKYLPVAIMLAGHRPHEVWAILSGNTEGAQAGRRGGGKGSVERKEAKVGTVYDHADHGGARTPVREALRGSKGHALDAFEAWLKGSANGFKTRGDER